MADDTITADTADNPDPMAAFAPAGTEPEIPPDEWPTSPLLPPEVEAAADDLTDAAPAPEAPRPAVKYIGTGGDRAYSLLYPVKIEGHEVRRVIIRHPTLWVVEDWIAGKIKTNFALIGCMTDLPEAHAGALRWPDAQAVITIVTSMLPEFIQRALEAQGEDRGAK